MRTLPFRLSLLAVVVAAAPAAAEPALCVFADDFSRWCGTDVATAVIIDDDGAGGAAIVSVEGEARDGANVGDAIDCDDVILPCNEGLPAVVLVGSVGQLIAVEGLFDNEVGTMVDFASAVDPIALDDAIDAAFIDDGAECIDRLHELSNAPRSDSSCNADRNPFGSLCSNIGGDISVGALGALLLLLRRRRR